MRHTPRWLAPAVLATIISSTFAAPARAQGNEAEAKIHYQKGVDLYNESAYTAALAELEKAYALSPHYRVLYSLALVRAQLSDFVGALRAFQEYQAVAVDESPQRKAEVKERIEALQQKVSAISIKVNVDDAEVYIDDQLKGTSPFPQPVLVNPGNHVIYARKGSAKTEPKSLTLGGGATRIALELEQPSSTSPTAPLPTTPAPQTTVTPTSSGVSPVTIGLIATGALAAGAVTTGLLTLGARGDLKDKQNVPTKSGDLDSASSKVSTLALVTDILGGGALIAGGVTLYLALKKKPEGSKVQTTTPATGAWLTVGPSSVGVAGRF